jgi:putative lipoprotein
VKLVGSAALVVALTLVGVRARAADPDPWWGRDKALHFTVSIGLGAGAYTASTLWLDERWQRAALGAGFSLSLGAGKELYDGLGAGQASWRDFTWDVAGTAVGVALAWAMDLIFVGAKPNRRADGNTSAALVTTRIAIPAVGPSF